VQEAELEELRKQLAALGADKEALGKQVGDLDAALKKAQADLE
jgi:hypothetical protein